MTTPPDNARTLPGQSQSHPHEAFLTVEHAGRPEHTPDVEGVLVVVDRGSVTLSMEDGERLVFDLSELTAAIAPAAGKRA